jgi:hypothetical protein
LQIESFRQAVSAIGDYRLRALLPESRREKSLPRFIGRQKNLQLVQECEAECHFDEIDQHPFANEERGRTGASRIGLPVVDDLQVKRHRWRLKPEVGG